MNCSVVNVIDRKTGEMTKWGLNGAKANYPMALDEDDHRLFVVTRRPPLLIVLDTDTGNEVARVPVGVSCDDVFYDAERKRIYAIGGEGFVSGVQQNDPDHYAFSANIPSSVGARTGIFMERAFTSECRHRDWKPRKYGITLCRSRVQGPRILWDIHSPTAGFPKGDNLRRSLHLPALAELTHKNE